MLLGTLGALFACSPDFPAPFWTGAHLAYATTTDLKICDGSWVVQDRYVGLLSDLLGVSLPRPVRFALIERDEREKFCEDSDLLGCTRDDESYSIYAVQLHELAHAVAAPAGIRGPVAFQEGLAEVFSDGQDSDPKRLPIGDVLDNFAGDGGSYYTAGLFVRFLIEDYGLEKLLTFMRATDEDDSPAAQASTFADVYGVTLEQAAIDFEDYPSCKMWSNRIAVFECEAELVPWEDSTWRAASSLACESPDVLGPVPDGAKMFVWETRALMVEADGKYLATAGGDVGGAAAGRLTRCGSCWDSLDEQVRVGDARVLNLSAGRYYVTLLKEVAEAGEVTFTLAPQP